jgi:hypothetical protein
MKTIRIQKFHDPLLPNKNERLDAAAQALAKRTKYSIVPIDAGFQIEGQWVGKFESEEKFARRVARDLQLSAEVIFDYTIV